MSIWNRIWSWWSQYWNRGSYNIECAEPDIFEQTQPISLDLDPLVYQAFIKDLKDNDESPNQRIERLIQDYLNQ